MQTCSHGAGHCTQHITYFHFGAVLFVHLFLLVLLVLISTYFRTYFTAYFDQIHLAFQLQALPGFASAQRLPIGGQMKYRPARIRKLKDVGWTVQYLDGDGGGSTNGWMKFLVPFGCYAVGWRLTCQGLGPIADSSSGPWTSRLSRSPDLSQEHSSSG